MPFGLLFFLDFIVYFDSVPSLDVNSMPLGDSFILLGDFTFFIGLPYGSLTNFLPNGDT